MNCKLETGEVAGSFSRALNAYRDCMRCGCVRGGCVIKYIDKDTSQVTCYDH